MIYFLNFQDNNLDKVNDVNDVLDKCVKNDNLDTIDNTCKLIASLKTEIVSISYSSGRYNSVVLSKHIWWTISPKLINVWSRIRVWSDFS